jgi:hypothetical protein
MVTVFLRGGLGNQMFQYAAGLSVARKNNTKLVLDATYLNDRFPRKNFTYRTYDMDVFTMEPEFTRLSKVSGTVPVPGLWLGLDLAMMKAGSALGAHVVVTEKEGDAPAVKLAELDKNKGKDIVLYGRWQSEGYFKDVEAEIRGLFRFRHEFDVEAARLAQEITNSNSVALCVRRGDYVAFASAKKMMGDTNTDYYAAATNYIKEHIKDPRYVVFSDDLEWCKQTLGLPPETLYIGKMGPKWSFHLRLMSLCKYSIIANSTFYWWGAWLNESPGKVIIAPKRWYATVPSQEVDIIPDGWVIL